MSNETVCPDALERAKELYFKYTPVTQISEITGINRSTVQYHVSRKWKQERLFAKQDLMSSLLEGKEESLGKITDYSIRSLERALRAIAVRDEAPTVNEAKNIVMILEKIDMIVAKDREESKKNEDSEEKPTSLEEIKKSLSSDPFTSM